MAQTLAEQKRKREAKKRAKAGGTSVVHGSEKAKPVTKTITPEELRAGYKRRKAKKALSKLPKSATAGRKVRRAGMEFSVSQLEKLLAKKKKKR